MELTEKDLILKEIPLFAGLSDDERNTIKEKSRVRDYKKGQVIYKEGSPSDAFYCVALGRVMIYTQDQYQKKTVLEYLHRGKYFGIISLLTGEPHSVSAEAINDCVLLVIQKADFNFILKEIPCLAIGMSQSLSRRLKNKSIHQKTIFESTIISVFSSYAQAGKTVYALNLALSLNKETHKATAILEICLKDKLHSLPAKLDIAGPCRIFNLLRPFYDTDNPQGQGRNFCGPPAADTADAIKAYILHNRFGVDLLCLSYGEDDELCVKNLVGVLSTLVNDYHYIILDLPSVMDRTVFDILHQSDIINILTSPAEVDLKRTHNLIERLIKDFNFPQNKIKIIINEYKFSKLSHEEQAALLNHQVFATLPKIEFSEGEERLVLTKPDCEYAKAARRISRELGDYLVGLALGVGFAYGFCHIGVLKIIEEEDIPIDAISGSSIGALIAGLWAVGRTSGEILKIAKEFREQKYIWGLMDLTLPFLGFIKGNKLYSFLKKHFGGKTFYDVKCPLKIVTSDVRMKEPRIIDKGLLADAIMASCTMPGVFMPFKLKEEMLFDGGVINPLPTEVLVKMGVKKIIAVNVTPSREDILNEYEKISREIKMEDGGKKRWFSPARYLRKRFKTNILGIIFSSIETLQSEVAQKEAQLADIVLHPDTAGLHWLELHRADDFAKRGEEEARKNLSRIRQLINE